MLEALISIRNPELESNILVPPQLGAVPPIKLPSIINCAVSAVFRVIRVPTLDAAVVL